MAGGVFVTQCHSVPMVSPCTSVCVIATIYLQAYFLSDQKEMAKRPPAASRFERRIICSSEPELPNVERFLLNKSLNRLFHRRLLPIIYLMYIRRDVIAED